MKSGMELWAIVPELILGGLVLVLLPLGAFSKGRRAWLSTGLALLGITVAGATSAVMLSWSPQPIFEGTYAVDPFAVFFKLLALAATGLVLLATHSHFRGKPHEHQVPTLLVLTCLGLVGLAASQDLALIALFLQLIGVGSYTLVGIAKGSARATEGAVKLFLFTAAAGAVMIYGLSLLYGLTGSLRLPEIAARLGGAPVVATLLALAFVLFGFGFKITLVPFHAWAPDAYQGAPTPIAGFLAVGPKAAGLAVLARTLLVGLPGDLGRWSLWVAGLAALSMTVGNLLALRQTSAKRLLAYSSIAQAGYLLVGVASAARGALGMQALLVYLSVYLFMELGAFLAVDALERAVRTDEVEGFVGLGKKLPLASATLALCLLCLAGIPPLGGFFGKALLLGAALEGDLAWLAVVLVINVAISLYYYVRVLEPLYLRASTPSPRVRPPRLLQAALLMLALGTLATGVLPQPWMRLASRSSTFLEIAPTPAPMERASARRPDRG